MLLLLRYILPLFGISYPNPLKLDTSVIYLITHTVCCVFQEEYEAARTELQEEIARGASIQDIRARLTKTNDKSQSKEEPPHVTESDIPDDLAQVQAYIRWEKAGKPNYPPERQIVNAEPFLQFM